MLATCLLQNFSNGCVHGLDVLSSIQIEVDEVALAEVVVAVLEEVVLGEALLEAHTLLLVQLAISHGRDVERALAEGDRVAQTRD